MEQQQVEINKNKVLYKLSSRISLFGKILIVLGSLYLIGGLVTIKDNYGNIFEGILQIILGYLTVRVSILFKKASTLENPTLEDLLVSFEATTNLYTMQLYFYGFIFFLALFTLLSLAWTNLS
ncbi:hypothetical protein [Leptospira brenneri]|uniref:Uncharacterized protein n=1 Tax=Leptospira brenneri TaxID=2023182 RepID=A0A2M9Y3P5_9LEPT|nr:hypothetical protein [Leptospira brenneri]PJZ46109.1 hypothetical protein CH361_09120 [Leptospira brenneri]TGK91233.1 hypothetical protein EHQ30_13430 [Leptospira brenneri]